MHTLQNSCLLHIKLTLASQNGRPNAILMPETNVWKSQQGLLKHAGVLFPNKLGSPAAHRCMKNIYNQRIVLVLQEIPEFAINAEAAFDSKAALLLGMWAETTRCGTNRDGFRRGKSAHLPRASTVISREPPDWNWLNIFNVNNHKNS